MFEGAYGLKIHTSKKALSFLLPQNPLAEMSRGASSSLFAVAIDSVSPLSCCKAGSTLTLWHTSDIRQAVKSLISIYMSDHGESTFETVQDTGISRNVTVRTEDSK